MIRALVFDVGNVLTWWKPEVFCLDLFPDDPNLAKEVAEKAFHSPLWYIGDDGSTDMASLARRITSSERPELQEASVYAFTHFPEVLIPNKGMIEFLKESKKKGYVCYLLSNYCELFETSIQRLGIASYLDGYVYSHKEKKRKPNLDIYETLLQRYGLNGEECFFLDDKIDNVQASKKAGFGYACQYRGDDGEIRAFVRWNGLFG